MSQTTKYIELICYFIIFLLGISSTILLITSYDRLFQSQINNSNTRVQNVLYKNYNTAKNEYDTSHIHIDGDDIFQNDDSITRSELVATLFYELEYDIQIDSELISKADNLETYVVLYGADNRASLYYSRSYTYSKDGIITRVIYTSIPST